jgi:hypothetical protein
MPSDIIIRVKCDAYLVRFAVSLYGNLPINFPKNSHFLNLLEIFIEKKPLDFKEPDYGNNMLWIQLPYFENKNIVFNNYLSPVKQQTFVNELRKYFKITFRKEVAQLIVHGIEKQDAINIFIEKYNLSQDCWDFLQKDFYRYLNLRDKRRLFRTKKNTSV